MPDYDFRCPKCDDVFEVSRRMSQSGDPQACAVCGTSCERVFAVPGMVFAGDGWESKNGRIAAQMAMKNRRLDHAQQAWKHDAPGVRLAPNVDGEQTDTWADAKKLAASKGKNASSYDAMARKEAKK